MSPTYIAKPPDDLDLFQDLNGEDLLRVIEHDGDPAREAGYPHWDKLRHLEPPEGLTTKQWWWKIRNARASAARSFPLEAPSGELFNFSLPDSVLKLLHFVDKRCAGEVAMPGVVTGDAQARQHYLVNSLMEEAIRSSQLEGATTSRRVAKELLTTGREPKDRSELMIMNNYRALQFMRSIGDRLTAADVLQLHRILTEGTLDNPDAAGRMQRPDEERVAVLDSSDGSVLHVPPPAQELPKRLEALCAFANAEEPHGTFVHPVVRAILLHFWLAYDHPFEDGNGRTARALFYWCLRTRGYWLVEYLSISKILRKAPARYMRAYLLTETDHWDTTYFLLYQLQVVERALEELHEYLRRKIAEVREVEQLLRDAAGFNHRQLALLGDALRDSDRIYTYGAHAASHSVTHETARSDLAALADQGLLIQQKVGRRYYFRAPDDLGGRLQSL